MKLIAKKDFSYSTDGIHLVAYNAGAEIDTDDKGLIEVSLEQGWAVSPAKKVAPENKARKAAPENK